MLSKANTPDSGDLADALRARLAGFSGFLQANGFGVGGGDACLVLAAVSQVGILHPQMLRWSLQALLCGRASGTASMRCSTPISSPPIKRCLSRGRASRHAFANLGRTKTRTKRSLRY